MKSVLIVDDSVTTRSLIKAMVEEIDDLVTTEASTGFEALKTLPLQPFDLITIDINMPDISGFELINFVKNNPQYKNIPVIIVTTERNEEEKNKCMALGVSGYLTKPFRTEDLQSMVRKVLNL